MPRACTISAASSYGKSQKETVISKVFIDVKSTTTRQIPFINALFVRKVMPESWCGREADSGARSSSQDAPHCQARFCGFSFLALMVGCLFATGGRQ